jgi:hypothetical protein
VWGPEAGSAAVECGFNVTGYRGDEVRATPFNGGNGRGGRAASVPCGGGGQRSQDGRWRRLEAVAAAVVSTPRKKKGKGIEPGGPKATGPQGQKGSAAVGKVK